MFPNALGSELAAIVGVIDPDAYTNSAYETGYIDMSQFETLMVLALLGDMVSTSTLNVKIQTSATASGGADLAGKAITPLTEAGEDDNKQAIINLRREEMPEGHRYVKVVATIGAAASDFALVALGMNPRQAPASDFDLASVDEIVA